jgi:hypothetical protein
MEGRFLNDSDYLSIITQEALDQLIRGRDVRKKQAEDNAEVSIVEYLVEGYKIKEELNVGKSIGEYDYKITYPAGAHFYYNDKICMATRTITGRVLPELSPCWKEYLDDYTKIVYDEYSQLQSYMPGQYVSFNSIVYECVDYNGANYGSVKVPGISGWAEKETKPWEPNVGNKVWDVVSYNGKYYALLNTENIDLTVNPLNSDNWGLIGDYDKTINTYEFSSTEYVVYKDKVFYPTMDVNSDTLEEEYNFVEHDPRNQNIKKHMTQMALYELHKLISPNNVSSVRITDYNASLTWLQNAARMRLNPGIPRKVDDEEKPIAEYAMATFARDYDPYKNAWQL